MGHRKKTSKRSRAKTILRLPDLEQSKNAVLNSLAAASSQESYGHAIDEFIGWYCSEPRLVCIAIQYPTKPRAAPATAGGFPHPKSPNPRFLASHCSLPLASLRA